MSQSWKVLWVGFDYYSGPIVISLKDIGVAMRTTVRRTNLNKKAVSPSFKRP
jgi:hypothetical protein